MFTLYFLLCKNFTKVCERERAHLPFGETDPENFNDLPRVNKHICSRQQAGIKPGSQFLVVFFPPAVSYCGF